MTFAQQIKEWRKRLGYTQAQAAQVLGATKRALETWEQGKCEPLPIAKQAILTKITGE